MNTTTAAAPGRGHRPVGALAVVVAIGAAALLALAADKWFTAADPREVPAAASPVLPTSAQQQPDAHDITRWTSAVDWSRLDPAGDVSPQSVAAYDR